MNDTERPEQAADAIERAAKALWDYRRRDTGWEPWEELRDTRPDGSAVESRSHYRDMARAALQAAAGDDLDAMLNNIHPNTTASLQFIQPYLITDPEPYWQAHVSVPTGGLTGFQKHRGTGPTRMAAIADAVRQAKGAEGSD